MSNLDIVFEATLRSMFLLGFSTSCRTVFDDGALIDSTKLGASISSAQDSFAEIKNQADSKHP